MQQWKERIVTAAAIASDVGLFGSLFYFFQLTRAADYVQISFAAWFLGLCLVCFIDTKVLRRGCTVRAYLWWNLVLGAVFGVMAHSWYEADVKTIWSWIWFYVLIGASLLHTSYIARHRPAVSATVLYLDGTVAALIGIRLWEHLNGAQTASGLGKFMMFSIGMNFLALMMTVLAEQKEGKDAESGVSGDRIGSFPVFVPVMFGGIAGTGVLFVLLGERISGSLVGALVWLGHQIWKGIASALEGLWRFLVWLSSFFPESEETVSALPEAMQVIIPQGPEHAGVAQSGLLILVLLVAAGIAAVLWIDGKRFLNQRLSVKKTRPRGRIRRSRSKGLWKQFLHKIRERLLFGYRYLFHPEDIRMLVTCAEYYGKKRNCGRAAGETLRAYFFRLAQQEGISAAARRLGELSEQFYYSGRTPTISRKEGKQLRKIFGFWGRRE